MVTLKETIEKMTSDNYKDRFVAEFYQLKIRRDKLENFIIRARQGKEKHDCPLDLLERQLACMDKYLEILCVRVLKENIKL